MCGNLGGGSMWWNSATHAFAHHRVRFNVKEKVTRGGVWGASFRRGFYRRVEQSSTSLVVWLATRIGVIGKVGRKKFMAMGGSDCNDCFRKFYSKINVTGMKHGNQIILCN